MNIDHSHLIHTARRYMRSDYKASPAYMSDLLEKVRDAITEEAASSEQQAELVALEKELEKLSDPSARFFPRSRRIDQ